MSNPAPVAPKDKPKGSTRSLLIIAASIVVLAGGGGAAYWSYARDTSPEEAEAAASGHEEVAPAAPVALETFIVNLTGSGRSHYLRTTLSLIVEDEKIAAEIAENEVAKMRVRSAILELLALQTAEHLVTPAGKTELKTAIAEAAGHAMAGLHVTDVLFSEFVVQY